MTSFQKQRIYITPNIVVKKMNTVHFNLIIFSKNLCRWRKNLSLRMCLNHTVHPLMKAYPSWKVVFSLHQRFRQYFHHLAINSYLHPKKYLTDFPILYQLKQKDLFDYDPRCIMSSVLMSDDIIMNIIRNIKL